jgi:hypothetical protein
MLTRHADGLFTRAAPLSLLGIRIGTRMTVVRLPGGALLVHSPVPIDEALRAAVDAEGTVAHVVAPNAYHHLFAGQWAKAYPDAVVYAPRVLRGKRRDLRIDRVLEDVTESTFGGALVPHRIEGSMLEETVFVHPATRSVVSADLTENFVSGSDHLPTRLYLKASGIYKKPGWGRFLRALYRDRKAARRSIDALLEHDFDRAIVAHGEVLERDAKAAVRETFTFLD